MDGADIYLAYMRAEQLNYHKFYASSFHAEPEDSDFACEVSGYHATWAANKGSRSAMRYPEDRLDSIVPLPEGRDKLFHIPLRQALMPGGAMT